MNICALCGVIIDLDEGDDEVTHEGEFYHFTCLDEGLED